MTTHDSVPLWWRIVSWLPAKLFIACAVCLFWRGAAVGFGIACVIALATLKYLQS